MKKTFLAVILGTAFLAVQTNQAQAHDRGFNPVGAVIGGIVAGAVIADVLTPHPVYYASAPQPVYCPPPAPAYCPPQVVYAPAPVYYAQPAPVVVYREPVVRFGYGWGWGRHDSRHDRHGWR